MTSVAVDPTTGERLPERTPTAAAEIETAIRTAVAVQAEWALQSPEARARPLSAVAARLRARAPELARLMAREMGKPVGQGRAEIEKCAAACDYYAAHAPGFLASEPVDAGASRSVVAFRPLGVLLAVMPWNFPFWQVVRFAAPALAAGNAGLLKHAANVPGCAEALEEVVGGAFPAGLFRSLAVGHAEVEALLARREIAGLSLTGSTDAGRSLGALAGRWLKPCVLELGGSDAYVVLEDADLALAAATCVQSRLVNAGQSCIAAKRFIVVDAVREELTGRVRELMSAVRWGNPLEEDVEMGPLARFDLRDSLHDQVLRSVRAGAALVLGGAVPDGQGAFYPPTLLTGVLPGKPAFDEELFGPVAAIVPARNEEEAVDLANATPFGLGAAVFTADAARGERLATERLQAGSCFVNAMVRSDPRLPFGGTKDSGHGRELGRFGLLALCNVKTVWVA